MTTLHTERLALRPYTADDVEFVFDMYSRWEVRRYLGRSPQVMVDRAEAVETIKRWNALQHPVYGIWLIVDTQNGERLGTALLKELPASGTDGAPSGEVEVGWHLHPDAWGRGVATEAARALLLRAFDHGLPRVLAVTYPANQASQRVALRLGMRNLGLTADYYDMETQLFAIDAPA